MALGELRINVDVQVVGAKLLAAKLRAVRLAALVAGFSARHRQNVTATVGILAMAAGTWVLFGVGVGLVVFGAFTWGTTVIAAELGARRAKEAG